MEAKLTRLAHKIRYNCAQWQRAVPFAVIALGGQSGNFWIHPRKAGQNIGSDKWTAYITMSRHLQQMIFETFN